MGAASVLTAGLGSQDDKREESKACLMPTAEPALLPRSAAAQGATRGRVWLTRAARPNQRLAFGERSTAGDLIRSTLDDSERGGAALHLLAARDGKESTGEKSAGSPRLGPQCVVETR